MTYRLILSPDAKADFRSAAHWYADKDNNLSFRFRVMFDFVVGTHLVSFR